MRSSAVIEPAAVHQKDPDRWLVLIGILKLAKALLFVLVGFGVIRLLHKDLVDLFTRAITDLRFDPESHFVDVLLDKIALLNDHRLRQITAAIFCYAAIDVIEGVGLILEQAWAEYLTLILTASFLPWELFEFLRHATWLKFGLIAVNAALVAYLVFHVRSRARRRAASTDNEPKNADLEVPIA